MKLYATIIMLFWASSLVSHGEPVYYAVHAGENYERISWHRSPTQEDFNKLLETAEVFDSYTVTLKEGKTSRVHRSYATPSGDWSIEIEYYYREDGALTKILYHFGTLTGYDADSGDFLPTLCVREFSKDESGKFIMVSEKITDAKSGKVVDRSFHTPDVIHWNSIAEIPQPTNAEQGGTGQPATRPESKSEGSDKPQPEAEGRSR